MSSVKTVDGTVATVDKLNHLSESCVRTRLVLVKQIFPEYDNILKSSSYHYDLPTSSSCDNLQCFRCLETHISGQGVVRLPTRTILTNDVKKTYEFTNQNKTYQCMTEKELEND